jgi:hypothetical protein
MLIQYHHPWRWPTPFFPVLIDEFTPRDLHLVPLLKRASTNRPIPSAFHSPSSYVYLFINFFDVSSLAAWRANLSISDSKVGCPTYEQFILETCPKSFYTLQASTRPSKVSRNKIKVCFMLRPYDKDFGMQPSSSHTGNSIISLVWSSRGRVRR